MHFQKLANEMLDIQASFHPQVSFRSFFGSCYSSSESTGESQQPASVGTKDRHPPRLSCWGHALEKQSFQEVEEKLASSRAGAKDVI